ncbi:unnamed protein product [Closterium sp. NIES-65]|nr:unnamed protein product [Closterium sp. NIES-65]
MVVVLRVLRVRGACPMLLAPCFSPHAPRPMLLAPCSSPHAPRPMLLAPCSSPHAPRPMLLAPCSSPHASRPMLLVPCFSPHASRPMLLAPCFSRHASRAMLLAPCYLTFHSPWLSRVSISHPHCPHPPSRPSQQQREKAGQVGEFRRQAAVQQRCQQCIDSPARPRHLVVSVAAHSYLMLPPGGSLLPNHVLIVPSEVSHTVQWPHKAPLTLKTPAAVAMHARAPHSLTPSTPCHSPPRWWQHEGSMRVVEEAVWDEVRNFKKCLTRMAMATQEGAGVIFLESAMGVGGAGRQRKHCYVEAIPVPAAVMAQAPLYFKKALDEAESEWSQQHSKRIIDTRAIRGGLRSAIPPNFPYFHVEFSLQGGYCHVIDDESAFKASLGRDVIAGIMEMDPQSFGGRARARGGRGGVGSRPQEVQQSVTKFMESWKPFDWTKMLDG